MEKKPPQELRFDLESTLCLCARQLLKKARSTGRREYTTVQRVHAAELGWGIYSTLAQEQRRGRQQAEWADVLRQYLHVCPACPFSFLNLFLLEKKRKRWKIETDFTQVHETKLSTKYRKGKLGPKPTSGLMWPYSTCYNLHYGHYCRWTNAATNTEIWSLCND